MVGSKSGSPAITLGELRDPFSLHEKTECRTHNLLGCSREGKGYITEPIGPATTPVTPIPG